jgi:hypothetical protein
MKPSRKPVRKCHACPLNLGDHCWAYDYPRGQWRGERRCPGQADAALQARYDEWLKEPRIKTGRELRRAAFRTRKRSGTYSDAKGSRAQASGKTARKARR